MEPTPTNTVACFLQDLTDRYAVRLPVYKEENMEEQIYLVNVKPMPHKSFLIRAKNEREAEEAAKHMIDTTVYRDKSTFLVQACDIPQQGKFSDHIYSMKEIRDTYKEVYLVDYSIRVGFTIPVLATSEEEAREAADKCLDTGKYVPNVQDQIVQSKWYDDVLVSDGWTVEDARKEYGTVFDADEILEEVNNILGHIHENRGFHLDFTDGPAEYSGVVVCAIEPCKKPDEDTMVVSEGCKVVFIEMNTLQDDRGYDEDDEFAARKVELSINEAFARFKNTSANVLDINENITLRITIGSESRTEEVRLIGNV